MMQKIKEKTVEYFPHDYHARDELQEILLVLGHEGKSVYWDLVEMLYENGGYLELSKIKTFAFSLHTSEETISKLINDFDLFKKDDVNFWSESVLRRYALRMEISKQRREAGKIGANKRWNKTPKKPPKEKEEIEYKKFDEFKLVKITEEHYQKIIDKWGERKGNKMVEELDIWLSTSTKRAKEARKAQNHYAYFRADAWLSTRADEAIRKEQGNKNNAISSEYGTY